MLKTPVQPHSKLSPFAKINGSASKQTKVTNGKSDTFKWGSDNNDDWLTPTGKEKKGTSKVKGLKPTPKKVVSKNSDGEEDSEENIEEDEQESSEEGGDAAEEESEVGSEEDGDDDENEDLMIGDEFEADDPNAQSDSSDADSDKDEAEDDDDELLPFEKEALKTQKKAKIERYIESKTLNHCKSF